MHRFKSATCPSGEDAGDNGREGLRWIGIHVVCSAARGDDGNSIGLIVRRTAWPSIALVVVVSASTTAGGDGTKMGLVEEDIEWAAFPGRVEEEIAAGLAEEMLMFVNEAW